MMRTLALLVLCSTPLTAQAASFVTFGNPCAYAPPPLTASTLPRLGSNFVLETLSGGSGGYDGGSMSALLVGTSNRVWLGTPLPWTPATVTARIGAGACGELSVSIDAMVAMPSSLSRDPVMTSIPIPNAPSLLGVAVYFQALDWRINTRGLLGLTFGIAGEARIGT